MRSTALSQILFTLGFISHFATTAQIWSQTEDRSQTPLNQDEVFLPLAKGELLKPDATNRSEIEANQEKFPRQFRK